MIASTEPEYAHPKMAGHRAAGADLGTRPATEPLRIPAKHRGSRARPQPSRVAEQTRGRDPFFDNAKFLAMVLVVVAHNWEPVRDQIPAVRALYVTIYAFHMPVFILISGYLSRSFASRPDQVKRIVATIVVPYIIFESSYELFGTLVNGENASITLLEPGFAMWFLIALFIWRLTAPLWRAVKPPVAIAAAALISLLAGTAQLPDTLDMQRIFGYLPFFVLGLAISPRYFDLVRTRAARLLAVPVLLGALVMAYVVFAHSSLEWIFWRESYHQIGATDPSGLVRRAAMLVVGFVLISAFLALVPRRRTWITDLGAGTLYAYLLHRYVRKIAKVWDWYDLDFMHGAIGVLIITAGSVLLTILLASPLVRDLFRPLVEPRLNWVWRRLPGKDLRRDHGGP